MKNATYGSPAAAEAAPGHPVDAAREALAHGGAHLMPPADTASCLGVDAREWERFRTHWDDLRTDAYASDRGVRRLRRYGQFSVSPSGERITPLPRATFVQPENSNPLYIGVDRTFEPLTGSFTADPVFLAVLRLLARVAAALDDPPEWNAKVHPFRVVASAGAEGLPTPEGRHRDGVTLVSSLLVGRQNAAGGESAVFTPDGERLLATTLSEPGALLLGDDRRTLHSVSPVRPVDPARPAHRDVLVVTFVPAVTPGGGPGPG